MYASYSNCMMFSQAIFIATAYQTSESDKYQTKYAQNNIYIKSVPSATLISKEVTYKQFRVAVAMSIPVKKPLVFHCSSALFVVQAWIVIRSGNFRAMFPIAYCSFPLYTLLILYFHWQGPPTWSQHVTHIQESHCTHFLLYIVDDYHPISFPFLSSILLSLNQDSLGYLFTSFILPYQLHNFCHATVVIQDSNIFLFVAFFLDEVPMRGMLSFILTQG